MKFVPDRCPECGELPRGTLETVEGVAEFQRRKDFVREKPDHDDPERDAEGGVTYSGWTEIFWDSQMTENRKDGDVICPILLCWNGHDWPAKRIDKE